MQHESNAVSRCHGYAFPLPTAWQVSCCWAHQYCLVRISSFVIVLRRDARILHLKMRVSKSAGSLKRTLPASMEELWVDWVDLLAENVPYGLTSLPSLSCQSCNPWDTCVRLQDGISFHQLLRILLKMVPVRYLYSISMDSPLCLRSPVKAVIPGILVFGYKMAFPFIGCWEFYCTSVHQTLEL